jgi:hypothetical protein
VTVVGEEPGGDEQTASTCDSAQCEAAVDDCGNDGAADVIVDADGEVLDVICYGQDVNVDNVAVDETGNVSAGNNTVLVLDGEDDGIDVEGDLTIDGNNAVIYGDGPDVSVISGTVLVEKNNAVIRGVRIQEDVEITKNNTKLLFCVIEGNLTITGNNTTVAECEVYGNVTITGLNTVLVRNYFEGVVSVSGDNLSCSDNYAFEDENEDFHLDDDEIGDEISCVDRDGSPMPQADADDVTSLDAGL